MKARIRPSTAPDRSRRSAGLAGLLGALACSSQLACSPHNAPGAALARSTAASGAAAMSSAAPRSSAAGAASAEPRFFVTSRAVTRPESEIVTRAREGGPRRSIVRGFRLVEHADGRFEVAQDVLPGVGEGWAPLPIRLGGGFVFWTVLGTETALYSAPEFTAPLRPLTRVDFNLERLATGFDRLYLFAEDTGEVIALDPSTGKVRDLGALPDAPGFAALEFVDDWFAVALPAFQGPLATFDAGSSWHPVPVEDAETLQPVIRAGRETAVALVGARGRTVLDAGGRLREEPPSGEPGGRPRSRGLEAARPRYGRGLERVEAAILHGYAETPSTALLLADGDLMRVQLQTGDVLARTENVSAERTTCSAIRLGAGAGFICAEPTGPSSVYQLVAPLALERVLRFTSPRKFTPSESGALVIEGPCAERAPTPTTTLERCVRFQDGRTRSLTLGAQSQIAVLPEQIVAEVVPPRTSRAGHLRLHGPNGVLAKPLRTRDLTPKVRKALENGLWLEGLEAEAGGVAGWIASGQRLVGVRIARDGSVRAGIIEDDLARTLVSGRFALSIRPGGAGRETTNFGFDWRSFSIPARLDTGARTKRNGERGCSSLGCVHGEWMRLGWGRVSTPLREPPTPEGAVFTSTGGGWWLLRCALTGRTLNAPRRDPRLVLRQVPRVAGWRGAAPTGLNAAVVESTPWTPFVGAAPPTRAPEDVTLQHVLDVPESPLAVYAAGPRDGAWSNRGKWVVRVADPYELESPVWSSAVSPTPWADVVPAALAFGHNLYGPPNPTLSVAIDPEGTSGVLFMHVPTTGTEAYLLQANQVLRRIDDGGAGLTSATSFVELGDRSFIGVDGDVFRIFEVQGGRAKEFGRYPKRVGDAGKAALRVQVVRSARGTRLGLWIRASKLRGSRTSYFVYEVDATTGALSSPLVVTPAALGKLPPACGADADGWLLEGPPPVSPYIEQPSDLPSPPRGIRARLIVNPNGICATGLFAETDIAIPTRTSHSGASSSSQSEPGPRLTLSDRSDPGRRWELRCRP